MLSKQQKTKALISLLGRAVHLSEKKADFVCINVDMFDILHDVHCSWPLLTANSIWTSFLNYDGCQESARLSLIFQKRFPIDVSH